MKLKYRTFKVTNSNYQRLVQVKKDFGLEDGDEIIDWLFDNLRLEMHTEPDETADNEDLPHLNVVSVEDEVDKVLGDK